MKNRLHWSPMQERQARARLLALEAQACNLSEQFYGKLAQSDQSRLLARRVKEMDRATFRTFCDAIRPELAKLKVNLWALAPGEGAATGRDSLRPRATGKM